MSVSLSTGVALVHFSVVPECVLGDDVVVDVDPLEVGEGAALDAAVVDLAPRHPVTPQLVLLVRVLELERFLAEVASETNFCC